jgi:hypothetical protein
MRHWRAIIDPEPPRGYYRRKFFTAVQLVGSLVFVVVAFGAWIAGFCLLAAAGMMVVKFLFQLFH